MAQLNHTKDMDTLKHYFISSIIFITVAFPNSQVPSANLYAHESSYGSPDIAIIHTANQTPFSNNSAGSSTLPHHFLFQVVSFTHKSNLRRMNRALDQSQLCILKCRHQQQHIAGKVNSTPSSTTYL